MARCTSCSAPLPANTNRCLYCNSRSDVDLHAKHPYRVEKSATHRICPNCDKPLQSIHLKMADALYIERCHTCFGLFFDKGEIETVLQNSVSNVFDINREHIDNINKDRFRKHQKIRYVKCPECRRHMNRVNFGNRSGVVVDQCIVHGIWLDSGELTHLLEWKKAGGQLLHQQHAEELEKRQKQKQNVLPNAKTDYSAKTGGDFGSALDVDIVAAVAGLLDKLF
ncbi:MAG: zf-TFIIB domain-containing protein [Methyloglobulus sp.]|nr:zf-TFIIB domain-containing protein [Methyloglobulus sp.]